jgi:Ca2+-transporting ATPase
VNAPFGIALGFDQETPGLMRMHPRARGDSVLTPSMMVTCGLVGLVMAIFNLAIIEVGIHQYGSTEIGSSMALVAFVLMLVVAAYESRSETASVFSLDTFNSSKMNWIAIAETAGGVLITQWEFMNRLLGTTPLTARQWGLGLAAALALLLLWELGKWVARRSGYGEAAAAGPA